MSGWELLWRVFAALILVAAAAYLLYAAAWALSIPVFRFTGRRWSVRPTPHLRRVLTSWLWVGPLLLANLTLVFGLFLCQYTVLHDVFQRSADPGDRLRKAAASFVMERGPETVERLLEAVGNDPGAGARQAWDNLTTFTGSGWYRAAEWMSRRLLDLRRAVRPLLLGFLVVLLLRDLGWTSWAMVRLPVELRRHPFHRRVAARETLGRILEIGLFTVFSSAFFAVCAGGMWLATTLLFSLAAWMAECFLVEILVAAVAGPVPPFIAFLLLAGFYFFAIEVVVLIGTATGLFIASSRRSLRAQADRLAGRWARTGRADADGPALAVIVWWTGRIVGKVACASLAVGAPTTLMLPLLGFPAGCLAAFVILVIGFNALLAWWRIDRDFAMVFAELRGGAAPAPPVVAAGCGLALVSEG